ncbi:DPY30 domain-containing protein 1 [Tupaia chinensis]|uniref:DPY30 domain-containing protein 1 n=1 Tax=Tupaia chinensis TaxID=246437 RepID=L8Y9K5_TUPCH|nr:DPY30 domain-containing protein 1 [Tupaia chinensis]
MAELERERERAVLEQEALERLKAEELLFQQQQLAFQLEMEMQEKERRRVEELQRAQAQLDKEAALDTGKTLAEISDRYGAPNLSRVEELDEPMLSDVSAGCSRRNWVDTGPGLTASGLSRQRKEPVPRVLSLPFFSVAAASLAPWLCPL